MRSGFADPEVERPHVFEPVAERTRKDSGSVARNRDGHLLREGLPMTVFIGRESLTLGECGAAVDQERNLVAEIFLDVLKPFEGVSSTSRARARRR